MLLIERAGTGDRDPHAGQMAFPGGRIESDDDSPEAAAIRETEEEVGFRPPAPALGALPPLFTYASFSQMQPFVFHTTAPHTSLPLQLSTDEIARACWTPWDDLMATFRMEWFERSGMRFQTPVFNVAATDFPVVWGATAMVLKNIRDRFSSLQMEQMP